MNPTQENAEGPIVQPVNFKKLAVQSPNIGQQDEMKMLTQITEQL
jgi:hypothetical protein